LRPHSIADFAETESGLSPTIAIKTTRKIGKFGVPFQIMEKWKDSIFFKNIDTEIQHNSKMMFLHGF
jgi:hypothetical protein